MRKNSHLWNSQRTRVMHGGAVSLPLSYFGGSESKSYSANPATSYQIQGGSSLGYSQGHIHGNSAGPNLNYGRAGGGGSKRKSRRGKSRRGKSRRHSKKH